MNNKLLPLTLIVFCLCLSKPLRAEFLSTLADSKIYGCSLQNKVHKVITNGASQELSAKAIKALSNKLKKTMSQSASTKAQKKKVKAAKQLLVALNKCKSGKLKHLDPCAALNLTTTNSQISNKLANSRVCQWSNSAILKVVSTFIDDSEKQCSAAAVSKHVVLTAQHCVFDSNGLSPTKVEVHFEDQQTREPDDIYAEPTYFEQGNSDRARYDIAALAFIEPLPISSPLKMLPRESKFKQNELALIVGFGSNELNSTVGSELRAGFLKIKQDATYSVELKYNGYPGESSICSGDLGGPLLVERSGSWQLAAIASYTNGDTNSCTQANSYYYTKFSDCELLDLFTDLLCSAPYHNTADGECIFNLCNLSN